MKIKRILRTALLLCALTGTSAFAREIGETPEALPPLPPDDVTSGTLTHDDVENSVIPERFADDFRYAGGANQEISVVLYSEDFEGKLQILDNRGNVIAESDRNDGTVANSWVNFVPRLGQRYTIRVTSETPWATGAYTLRTFGEAVI